MTINEAIVARHSVRQYIEKPIEEQIVARLKEEVDICNKEGNLHIQLVTNEPRAFDAAIAKWGRFRGVSNYLAMIGPNGADEAIGWYGERLVLLAQTLGLNSCWVGVSFRKQPDKYVVGKGEKLHCVIALGYGVNQGVQHHIRPMDMFVAVNGSMMNRQMDVVLPEWFKRGMEAALLAPTAVNQQKFFFELISERTVAAHAQFTLVGYGKMDLGIVKYHFEVAAGKENFVWG